MMRVLSLSLLLALGLSACSERVTDTGPSAHRDTPPVATGASDVSSPAAQVDPATQQLYQAMCATCHGPTGRGDGKMAKLLSTKPRSFVDDAFKYVAADASREEMITEFVGIIEEGLVDAGMTSFAGKLSAAQMRSLAEYVFVLRGE